MAVSSHIDEGGLPSGWIFVSLALLVVSAALLLWRKVSHDRNRDLRSKQSQRLGECNSLNDEEDVVVEAQPLTILYATQTGTAEGFAKVLAGEVKARFRNAVSIQTMDVDEFGATEEEYAEKFGKERVVCLLLATYGDGEPTDSAARFCKWLTNAQEEGTAGLPHLQYAVFGLGNKQYEHFNKVGSSVDAQLMKLGAHPIVPLGLGDDDACLEDDFTLWREALLIALDGLMRGGGTYEVAVPRYRLQFLDSEEKEEKVADPAPGLFCAPLVVRRELHSLLSDRSAVHCEVDISGSGWSYCAGDHVGVYPQNESWAVEGAARCLGIPLETRFELEVEEKGVTQVAPFPGPCSLRTALSCYADLLSPPKKAALTALAAHAASQQEADRLRHLASPEGKAEYATWVVEGQRSLVEVMEAFPSCHPPLEVFFAAVAPRLQPRLYSISSSQSMVGSIIHITCAVVEERREEGRVHRGVASTWLKESDVGATRVPLFVRPSTFRLPSDPLTPIVMVGPGTGLAPFRGFLQERSAIMQEGREVGEAHLFFGCRSPVKDYIYKEELEAFVASKALTRLHTSFSRVSDRKTYVQHALTEHGAHVWDLLHERGAHLYVCGDAKAMAKDVHRTLHLIVQKEGAMSTSAAEATVKRWQMDGRYLRDVW